MDTILTCLDLLVFPLSAHTRQLHLVDNIVD